MIFFGTCTLEVWQKKIRTPHAGECVRAPRFPAELTRMSFPSVSGLDVRVWGPAAWIWLHTVARQFPAQPSTSERVVAVRFLESFRDNIPCASCRAHFGGLVSETLREGPSSTVFAGGDSFFHATVDWHNAVNGRLGRRLVSHDEAHRMYRPPEEQPALPPSSSASTRAIIGSPRQALCLAVAAVGLAFVVAKSAAAESSQSRAMGRRPVCASRVMHSAAVRKRSARA